MLEFKEALSRILEGVPRVGIERVGLSDLQRRVLSEPLYSNLDLPVADNSSMDGYALRAEDIGRASEECPVELKVLQSVPAGEVPSCEIISGTCARVFTGSFLPKGADAVLMQEDTEPCEGGDAIRCLDAAKPWENVRFRGEDVKEGTLLIKEGTCLGTRHLSVIAALGHRELRVSCRPRIGILATGHELREPGTDLSPGAIYESNRHVLAELVRRAGGEPRIYPLVDDTMDATMSALRMASGENDAIITSGGVSVGDYDLIRPAIERLGGTIDFWKIRLRPGKPFVFASLEGKPVFGLPGNPVSAVTTYMVLTRPAILRMQGASQVDARMRRCFLVESITNNGDRPHFLRVRIDENNGVSSAGLQGSHALQSLSRADGWLGVGPGETLVEGDTVSVMIWDD